MVQHDSNRWIVAMAVSLASFMESLDISIANVALPHIAGSLGTTPYEGTWVVSSYLIASAIIVPLSASLSEWLGRKHFYMISVGVFTFSSLLCGLAPTMPLLILFRALQGVAGGGLQPCEQAILADMFEEKERGRAFAVYAVVILLAPILGPIIGGWITSSYDWRWIFFLNLPFGILSLILSSRVLRETPIPKHLRPRPNDFAGMSYIVLGAGLLQFVLDKGEDLGWFASREVILATSIVITSFTLLAWREWRHRQPVLDLRLLSRGNFRIALVFNFLSGTIIVGSTVLLPLFLQDQLGYSPGRSGLVLFPSGLLMAALMPVAAWGAEKFDPRKVIAFGFLITACGMAYSTRISLEASFSSIVWMRAMQVVGLPFILIPVTTLAFVGIGPEKNMQVSGLSGFAQNMGGAIGTALLTIFETHRTAMHRVALVAHVTQANPFYRRYSLGLENALRRSGDHAVAAVNQARALINRVVDAQASTLAFSDAYWVLAALVLLLSPMPFLMRRVNSPVGLNKNAGSHK